MISIVLAPEEGTAPVYKLTDEGREELSRCEEKRNFTKFHKHRGSDNALYREADNVFLYNVETIVFYLRH